MANKGIKALIQRYGGQRPASRALGIPQPTLNRWLYGIARVPLARALQLCGQTGVALADLRPDLAEVL